MPPYLEHVLEVLNKAAAVGAVREPPGLMNRPVPRLAQDVHLNKLNKLNNLRKSMRLLDPVQLVHVDKLDRLDKLDNLANLRIQR